MNRRTFLKSAALSAVAAPFVRPSFADPVVFAPQPGPVRSFELVTRIEIASPNGATRVWVPAPSRDFGNWFWAHGTFFSGNAADAALRTDPGSGATFVEASWTGEAAPVLEVVSRFSTRDRAVDSAATSPNSEPLSDAERAEYLKATKFVPLDGIVKEASDKIVHGQTTEIGKVRAIYEWVVDHTYRDGKVRGCGAGDVAGMLRAGTAAMGGKCADINPLFVGLVRAQGIPARDLYGIRVAPSQFGYKSLGPSTPTVTKAQHCRAEVYLTGIGWVPMDPADVRKVALEEPPGNLDMASDKVAAARKALFGAWETNWVPYNSAQDVRLSQAGDGIAFLMYPQAEVGGTMLDCLNADTFKYTITAREISI
ncbi:MAG: transglutaminase-like domain-containing protein [Alphaproteobacteria bacterium]